jgi:hypothetical protein
MKKKWQKPELIVLYRGKPEENLLGHIYCKMTTPKNLPDRAAGTICLFDQGGRAGTPCELYSAS